MPVRLRELPLHDGRRLTARDHRGNGSTPLVLLHGLLDTSIGWDRLAATTRRRCLAVDLGGFGGSDLPARPRIGAYADDVVEGLELLGPERVILVGHSLGGAIATAVAERIGDRARALVLLAPAGFGRIALAEAVSLPGVRNVVQATLPRALASRAILGLAYRGVVTNGVRADDELLARVMAHALDSVPGARDGTRAVVAAGLSRHGFARRRVAYDGPVVAVWGTHDRLVPRSHAEAVRRGLPQARVETWQRMGHHPQRERPERLARLIERVCADAARRRGGRQPAADAPTAEPAADAPAAEPAADAAEPAADAPAAEPDADAPAEPAADAHAA